ncbi:hypothetical protein POM88_040110 [Heracleum sosnowskyi]|uniref:Uncharacterized protein n=1 Tax=Heracleum sosnowskyi TaxID=360622 RepID=A0AAD8M9G9_9APIA|nr:hypothetical protein POM88_040110 [Heracleum sosnowskyi]
MPSSLVRDCNALQQRRTRGGATPPLITNTHDARPLGFTRQPLQSRPGGGVVMDEFMAGGGLVVEFMAGLGVGSWLCVRLKKRMLNIRKRVVEEEAIALMFEELKHMIVYVLMSRITRWWQAEMSSLVRDFNVLQKARMATGATPPLSTTPQAPRPMGFTRQSLQLRLERGLGLKPKNCPCVFSVKDAYHPQIFPYWGKEEPKLKKQDIFAAAFLPTCRRDE